MGSPNAFEGPHNPKVAGSNPAPAMSLSTTSEPSSREGFLFLERIGELRASSERVDLPVLGDALELVGTAVCELEA